MVMLFLIGSVGIMLPFAEPDGHGGLLSGCSMRWKLLGLIYSEELRRM